MHERRAIAKPVTVIDHEPLTDNDRPVFGKRNIQGVKAAVTRDFFSSPPSGTFKARKIENSEYQTGTREFALKNAFSVLPLKSLAAVLTIAIGFPLAFIAISEHKSNDDIDTMTTASVSNIQGLEISDVRLTRVLHQESSVATVFGKVSNLAGSNKPLRPLVITLYDKHGKQVQSWQHRIGKTEIQADQNYRFMTSAIDYSGEGRTVRVSIAAQN